MSIQVGNVVRVHYTGSLSDGTVFDTSVDQEPLEFTVGEEMLIPGFEQAVIGRTVGDKFTVTISPDDAYGEYSEELVFELPLSELPEGLEPEVGSSLELVGDEGELEVTIIDVMDQTVLLDANHELAGEELVFEIEILSVK